jgi:hypothetical protein
LLLLRGRCERLARPPRWRLRCRRDLLARGRLLRRRRRSDLPARSLRRLLLLGGRRGALLLCRGRRLLRSRRRPAVLSRVGARLGSLPLLLAGLGRARRLRLAGGLGLGPSGRRPFLGVVLGVGLLLRRLRLRDGRADAGGLGEQHHCRDESPGKQNTLSHHEVVLGSRDGRGRAAG